MTAKTIRVLIVETNLQHREKLLRILKQKANFEACPAEGKGWTLWNNAQDQIIERRCHVAVVGLRLRNPDDPGDLSGLELAKHLAPAGVVIYAPQGDDEVAYEAGWRRLGYVRHDHPPDRLIEAVDRQADEFFREQMSIAWPRDDFAAHVADSLKMPPSEITLEHLNTLLGRVFPRAVDLKLELLPSLEAADTVADPVRRSVVLWVSERRPDTLAFLTPKVVKIGPRERIHREVKNYKEHVDGWLAEERQAHLEGDTLLWHLGAVSYGFIGASPDKMVPFHQFYTLNSPQRVLEALQRLFVVTCRRWYEERERHPAANLFHLYDRPLNLSTHLERLKSQDPTLTFDGFPDPLPNPRLWALNEGRKATFAELTACITHGDLHADNFFVDRNGLAWLIDFEHTGPAHVLRDFVELEADIKLRLTLVARSDLDGLAALDRSLLSSETLDGLWVPTPEVTADPALFKAFEVIAGLRHLAHLASGVTDLREYLHALLYETLFMATLHRLTPAVRRRALFSAALIVGQRRDQDGPPDAHPGLPRLDFDALRQHPPAQAIVALQARMNHLETCYKAASLQRTLYGGKPSTALEIGLAQLREASAQTHRALQSFSGTAKTG